MKIAIIVNSQRQPPEILDKDNLTVLTTSLNIDYDLFILSPTSLVSTVKEIPLATYNAILIAGGDGTVRCVVQALVGEEIPIAIFPAGSFNIFAKELNYPVNLNDVLKIIKNYKTKKVDVGEVNGVIFINHSSIGFYSHILKLRKQQKNFFGKNKFLKMLFTVANLFKPVPMYRINFKTNEKDVSYETSLVFIGNNYHFTDFLKFGDRSTLSSGLLAIYILHCKTRWDIFKCLLSMLFNMFEKSHYMSEFTTNEVQITGLSKKINVVIDGDLFQLESPLCYKIHNKQLSVIVA